jgi:lysozyme
MTYDRIALRNEIERDEGRVAHAYLDSEGYLTIGIGHLIDEKKGGRLPDVIIDALFSYDLEQCEKQLDQYIPWWRQLSDNRQRALISMTFQLGISGLLKFAKMLGALQDRNWREAYNQALDSKWHTQTPARAKRVAEMFL